MDKIRGGLLSSAATAVGLAFADPLTCSMSDGAAALLDDAGGGGGGDGATEAATVVIEADGATGTETLQVADWMKGYSAAPPEAGALSNQEWVAKIGAKDPDDLVSRYRAAEKAIRDSGRVKIPGEGASEAEVKAFREAIGVPDQPEGYEIKLPDGADTYELDGALLDPLRAIALEAGIPKAAFEQLGQAFLAQQLEAAKAETAANDGALEAKLKEWGPAQAEKRAEFKRGAEVLGLKTADIAKIQQGLGVGETMDLIAKIGNLAGEDFFSGSGSAAKRFGVADLASAKAALTAFEAETGIADKLKNNDPEAKARHKRLIDAVAHYTELDAGKGRR